MSQKILVPTLGESVTEATVSKWLKNQGDKVVSDEPLVELETDKVNVEVPSPSNGVLENISVQEGQTVNVGAILGSVDSSKKNENDHLKEEKTYSPPPKKNNIKDKKIKKTPEPLVLKEEKISKTIVEDQPLILEEAKNIIKEVEAEEPLILDNVHTAELKKIDTKKILSPAARKIAEESKIDLEQVSGTGKNGVILKEDLMSLMGIKPKASERKSTHGPEERVKMTRLRMTIAKRLKEAQDNAAMLTTFNEVDMSSVMQMKKDYQEDFQKEYSVKLGLMSFFVKASVVALKNFPAVNAEIEGDHIIYKNYYNVSIAIGTDRGLIVPVLKKADELSFADIERNIFLLSEKARLGKITINDLQGGTFTISNGGIYGSMLSTPILNPPQTGILGMHNIVERPVVKEGNIVVRPIMYLALSYDHRIIDGKEAVSFLKTIKDCLEEPRRLFLDL